MITFHLISPHSGESIKHKQFQCCKVPRIFNVYLLLSPPDKNDAELVLTGINISNHSPTCVGLPLNISLCLQNVQNSTWFVAHKHLPWCKTISQTFKWVTSQTSWLFPNRFSVLLTKRTAIPPNIHIIVVISTHLWGCFCFDLKPIDAPRVLINRLHCSTYLSQWETARLGLWEWEAKFSGIYVCPRIHSLRYATVAFNRHWI